MSSSLPQAALPMTTLPPSMQKLLQTLLSHPPSTIHEDLHRSLEPLFAPPPPDNAHHNNHNHHQSLFSGPSFPKTPEVTISFLTAIASCVDDPAKVGGIVERTLGHLSRKRKLGGDDEGGTLLDIISSCFAALSSGRAQWPSSVANTPTAAAASNPLKNNPTSKNNNANAVPDKLLPTIRQLKIQASSRCHCLRKLGEYVRLGYLGPSPFGTAQIVNNVDALTETTEIAKGIWSLHSKIYEDSGDEGKGSSSTDVDDEIGQNETREIVRRFKSMVGCVCFFAGIFVGPSDSDPKELDTEKDNKDDDGEIGEEKKKRSRGKSLEDDGINALIMMPSSISMPSAPSSPKNNNTSSNYDKCTTHLSSAAHLTPEELSTMATDFGGKACEFAGISDENSISDKIWKEYFGRRSEGGSDDVVLESSESKSEQGFVPDPSVFFDSGGVTGGDWEGLLLEGSTSGNGDISSGTTNLGEAGDLNDQGIESLLSNLKNTKGNLTEIGRDFESFSGGFSTGNVSTGSGGFGGGGISLFTSHVPPPINTSLPPTPNVAGSTFAHYSFPPSAPISPARSLSRSVSLPPYLPSTHYNSAHPASSANDVASNNPSCATTNANKTSSSASNGVCGTPMSSAIQLIDWVAHIERELPVPDDQLLAFFGVERGRGDSGSTPPRAQSETYHGPGEEVFRRTVKLLDRLLHDLSSVTSAENSFRADGSEGKTISLKPPLSSLTSLKTSSKKNAKVKNSTKNSQGDDDYGDDDNGRLKYLTPLGAYSPQIPSFGRLPSLRLRSVLSLYYKSLTLILSSESSRLLTNEHPKLLSNPRFHKAVLAMSALSILHAYSLTRPRLLRTVMDRIHLEPIDFVKVCETFVRVWMNGENGGGGLGTSGLMPGAVGEFLGRCEGRVLEEGIWEGWEGWDYAKKKPNNSNGDDVAACNDDVEYKDESIFNSDSSTTVDAKSKGPKYTKCRKDSKDTSEDSSKDTSKDTSKDDGLTPSDVESDCLSDTSTSNTASSLVFRKVLTLAFHRIHKLCSLSLSLPPQTVAKIQEAFSHLLATQQNQLLPNRHLDQLILSTIYAVCKITQVKPEVSFSRIIEAYKQGRKGRDSENYMVIRSVRLEDSAGDRVEDGTEDGTEGDTKPLVNKEGANDEKQDSEKHTVTTATITAGAVRGNLIEFYNQVYVPRMKNYLVELREDDQRGGGEGKRGEEGGSSIRTAQDALAFATEIGRGMVPQTGHNLQGIDEMEYVDRTIKRAFGRLSGDCTIKDERKDARARDSQRSKNNKNKNNPVKVGMGVKINENLFLRTREDGCGGSLKDSTGSGLGFGGPGSGGFGSAPTGFGSGNLTPRTRSLYAFGGGDERTTELKAINETIKSLAAASPQNWETTSAPGNKATRKRRTEDAYEDKQAEGEEIMPKTAHRTRRRRT